MRDCVTGEVMPIQEDAARVQPAVGRSRIAHALVFQCDEEGKYRWEYALGREDHITPEKSEMSETHALKD
jgi:hypothetical protein